MNYNNKIKEKIKKPYKSKNKIYHSYYIKIISFLKLIIKILLTIIF